MTKKDYIAIAKQISEVKETTSEGRTFSDYNLGVEDTLFTLTHRIADVFEADNSRFDRDRFVKAALGEQND